MPFTKVDINKIIEEKRSISSEFKETWDESREEYRLIGEMVSLRKAQKLTQNELASITGNRQQVISRIEKHENSPSLKTFCNILNALGYKLAIVRKE